MEVGKQGMEVGKQRMEVGKQRMEVGKQGMEVGKQIRFVMSFWVIYDIICLIVAGFLHLRMKMNKHRMEMSNLRLCKAV